MEVPYTKYSRNNIQRISEKNIEGGLTEALLALEGVYLLINDIIEWSPLSHRLLWFW